MCTAGQVQYLEVIAAALRPLGSQAAFYLAAAVSDFYIPWPDMVCLTHVLPNICELSNAL